MQTAIEGPCNKTKAGQCGEQPAPAQDEQRQGVEEIEHLLNRQRPIDVHGVIEIADPLHEDIVPEGKHRQVRDDKEAISGIGVMNHVGKFRQSGQAQDGDHHQRQYGQGIEPKKAEFIKMRHIDPAQRSVALHDVGRNEKPGNYKKYRDPIIAVIKQRMQDRRRRPLQQWTGGQFVRQGIMQQQDHKDGHAAQQIDIQVTAFVFGTCRRR